MMKWIEYTGEPETLPPAGAYVLNRVGFNGFEFNIARITFDPFNIPWWSTRFGGTQNALAGDHWLPIPTPAHLDAINAVVAEADRLEYSQDSHEYWEETGSFRACCPICRQLVGLGHYSNCEGKHLFEAISKLQALEANDG